MSTSSNTSVGRRVRVREHCLDRERDARQLAARGDPAERPRGFARVRCEPEHDLVDARRVERDGVAVDLHGRLVGTGRTPSDGHLERGVAKTRGPAVPSLTRAASSAAAARRRADSADATSATRDEEPLVVGRAPLALALDAAQALGLRRRALAVREHGRLVVAVAALEAVDQREPLLEPAQLGRIVVHGLHEPARLARDVLDLGLEARDPIGERREPRVEALELA